jgi:hypothetical protein
VAYHDFLTSFQENPEVQRRENENKIKHESENAEASYKPSYIAPFRWFYISTMKMAPMFYFETSDCLRNTRRYNPEASILL